MNLRHPNGRGLILDDAEANRGAYIDKTSSIADSAKLRDCRFEHGSRARDSCQIYGGEFHESEVWGGTIVAGHPQIFRSTLNCSEVSGTAYLGEVFATGNTEICDSPRLLGDATLGRITLFNAIIYGSPHIQGSFEVTGRVHEGTWTRPPKHIKLPWCDLSECVDGKMLLNCYCRPVVWWLRFGPRIAKKWNWSQDMIDVTLDTIRREFYCQNDTQGLICPRDTLSSATTQPQA